MGEAGSSMTPAEVSAGLDVCVSIVFLLLAVVFLIVLPAVFGGPERVPVDDDEEG